MADVKFHFSDEDKAVEMTETKSAPAPAPAAAPSVVLGTGAPVLDADEGQVALLLSACAKNNVQKVLQLIRGGLSPDAADYDRRSGLHLSCSEGAFEVVKLLVTEGANPNVKDRFGSTPLDDALRNNHSQVVDYLKSVGAKFATMGKFEAELITACAENHLDEVKRLVASGVSVNCCDYDNRTPLHLAVADGHYDLAKYLLEQGADPKAEDRWGTTPLYDAKRHHTRTGANPMSELFASFDETSHPPLISAFTGFFIFWEIAMVVLFGIFMEYADEADSKGDEKASADAGEMMTRRYGFFQDVHVMIFVGFGFLMTFLRKNGYNSVGLNFLLGALCIQWFLLVNAFWVSAFHSSWHNLNLNISLFIRADFCAGSILIAYGAVLGKVSPFQMCVAAIIQVVLYTLNEEIGLVLKIADLGGSQVIHQFGAFFGLALSWVLTPKEAKGNPHNAAIYHSDIFAMIGTLFLWMYWPSFNAALGATPEGQHRAVINTICSMTGSCIAAFIASHIFRREGRFNMVDIQNATLAGGVGIGAACEMIVMPGSAMAIGVITGTVSVIGYVYIQPWLEKTIGLHDTCGVHNLHGMPSILGGLAAVIASSQADDDGENSYGTMEHLQTIWGDRSDARSANKQAAIQFAYMCITMGISVAGGLITGFILKNGFFGQRESKQMFIDEHDWEVPEIEIPYFYDHRGEIARDASGKLTRTNDPESSTQSASLDKDAYDTRLAQLENQLMRMKNSAPASSSSSNTDAKLEALFDKLLSKLENKA